MCNQILFYFLKRMFFCDYLVAQGIFFSNNNLAPLICQCPGVGASSFPSPLIRLCFYLYLSIYLIQTLIEQNYSKNLYMYNKM